MNIVYDRDENGSGQIASPCFSVNVRESVLGSQPHVFLLFFSKKAYTSQTSGIFVVVFADPVQALKS